MASTPRASVLNLLRDHLSRPQAAPKDLSDKELVAEINQGLSAENWKRYEELIDRRREETLTSDDTPSSSPRPNG